MNLLRAAHRGLGLLLFASIVLPCGASAAECFEGSKIAETCLDLVYEGCCDASGGVQWCETSDGPTCRSACTAGAGACGWAGAYYACGGEGADPTDTFPMACASCTPACGADTICVGGTCQPCACGAQLCGEGACGQSCGECEPGATCTAGLCVGAPTCVDVALVACDGLVSGDTASGTSAIDIWGAHGAPGPELAYRFVAAADDQISVALESSAALIVAATADACRADATLSAGPGDPFWLTTWVPVTAGATYFVVVDSPASGPAPFTFTLRCKSTCTPKCDGRACGDDGCGGSCGECAGVCAKGVCYPTDGCAADTATGAAGCPGCACEACVCAYDEYCCAGGWDSVCQGECLNVCLGCGALDLCGDGTCAGAETCGTCAADCACLEGLACSAAGLCYTPDCEGRECGDDGHGGSCGECTGNDACSAQGHCACAPACDGVACGDDGCGGACGSCEPWETCLEGACQTVSEGPDETCDGKSLDEEVDQSPLPDLSGPDADVAKAEPIGDDTGPARPEVVEPVAEVQSPADDVPGSDTGTGGGGGGGCNAAPVHPSSPLPLLVALIAALGLTRRRGTRSAPSPRREH